MILLKLTEGPFEICLYKDSLRHKVSENPNFRQYMVESYHIDIQRYF
jgi:hypothetical protein